MKICVVAYKFGTEKEIGEHLGTYHYFIEKMRRLAALGHEVTVVAPFLSFFKKGSENIDGVNIERYWPPMMASIWAWPLNRIIRFIYIKRTQGKVLKEVKRGSNIVYVWQARETGYAIAKIKHKLGVPFIFRQITAWYWHFQRTPSEIFSKKPWYKIISKVGLGKIIDMKLKFLLGKKSQMKYAKLIYEKADKIIFLSKAAIIESKELGLDPKKSEVLGVAIEEEVFLPMGNKKILRDELGIKGDRIILFIGRINFEEKGIGYLLEATKIIQKNIPDVQLIIIGGGGESEKMKNMVAGLGIGNNVQLLGKKSFSDLPKYINASNVFVVPSIWMEAFGHVTIEAMSCGIPVVTSDAGASPEINIDKETGFVVPARDSNALAHALSAILLNNDLEKKMGGNARKRILENYTYEAIINRCLKIIQEALNH